MIQKKSHDFITNVTKKIWAYFWLSRYIFIPIYFGFRDEEGEKMVFVRNCDDYVSFCWSLTQGIYSCIKKINFFIPNNFNHVIKLSLDFFYLRNNHPCAGHFPLRTERTNDPGLTKKSKGTNGSLKDTALCPYLLFFFWYSSFSMRRIKLSVFHFFSIFLFLFWLSYLVPWYLY